MYTFVYNQSERYLVTYILYSVAVSISFNQSTYIVNENKRLVEIVLVLNNSTGIDITVQVRTSDNTATGEQVPQIHKRIIYRRC